MRMVDGMKAVVAVALLAVSAIGATCDGAAAQQPPPLRVSGTIEKVEGPALDVMSEKLGAVKIVLTGDAAVFAISKAALADIKLGSYIAVGAMPQADGSQGAIQVTIFTESQRGIGEGFRPWDRPNGTMTNATVDTMVSGVDGPVLTVKYKDGEQKIVIPPDAVLLSYSVGDKAELKPGAKVAVVRAVKRPDGVFEANRINVGRGGVAPN
jgi:hypothetical protein